MHRSEKLHAAPRLHRKLTRACPGKGLPDLDPDHYGRNGRRGRHEGVIAGGARYGLLRGGRSRCAAVAGDDHPGGGGGDVLGIEGAVGHLFFATCVEKIWFLDVVAVEVARSCAIGTLSGYTHTAVAFLSLCTSRNCSCYCCRRAVPCRAWCCVCSPLVLTSAVVRFTLS